MAERQRKTEIKWNKTRNNTNKSQVPWFMLVIATCGDRGKDQEDSS
jgi:hypothetical protein